MTKGRVAFGRGAQWPIQPTKEPVAEKEQFSMEDLDKYLSHDKSRKVGRILTDKTRESHGKTIKDECLDFVCMRLADKESLNIDVTQIASIDQVPDRTFKGLKRRKYDLPTSFLSYGTFGSNAKNIVGMFSDWITPDCDRGKLDQEVDEMCHSYDPTTKSFTAESKRRQAKISMQGLEEELQFMCESGIRTVLVSLRSRHVKNLVKVLTRVIREYPDLMVWCKVCPKLCGPGEENTDATLPGETSLLSVGGEVPKNTTNPSVTIVEYMDRWYNVRKEVLSRESSNSNGSMLLRNFRLCLDLRQLLKNVEDFGTFLEFGGWAKIKYWMAEPIGAFIVGQSIFKCGSNPEELYLVKHRDNIKALINLLLRGYDIPTTPGAEPRHFAVIFDPLCNPENPPSTPKSHKNDVTTATDSNETVVFLEETEVSMRPPDETITKFQGFQQHSTPIADTCILVSPVKAQDAEQQVMLQMMRTLRRKTTNLYMCAMEEALEPQFKQKSENLEKVVQIPEAVYSTSFFHPDHVRMRTEENNPIKLDKYLTAISNALMDIKEQDSGKDSGSPVAKSSRRDQGRRNSDAIDPDDVLLIVFGAKSGVLIDRILSKLVPGIWKEPKTHPIKIIAVEPHNSFYNELRRKQKSDPKWQGRVWTFQSEFANFLPPAFLEGRKGDVVVLDIISNFPELSMAAELFTHISDDFLADSMYMIPQRFSSYLCPVYAPKLSLLSTGIKTETESHLLVVAPGLAFQLGAPWIFSPYDAEAAASTDDESAIYSAVTKTKSWYPEFSCQVTGLMGFYDVEVGDSQRYSNLPGTETHECSTDLPIYLPFYLPLTPGRPIRVRCSKRVEMEFTEKGPPQAWPEGEAVLSTTDKTRCQVTCEWELLHPTDDSGSGINGGRASCDVSLLSQRRIEYANVPDKFTDYKSNSVARVLNVG